MRARALAPLLFPLSGNAERCELKSPIAQAVASGYKMTRLHHRVISFAGRGQNSLPTLLSTTPLRRAGSHALTRDRELALAESAISQSDLTLVLLDQSILPIPSSLSYLT